MTLTPLPASSETESPSKKRQKLPDDLSDLPPLPSFKGMKKTEIKKLKKERERLEKKAAKQQAKVDAQERKRMRGESGDVYGYLRSKSVTSMGTAADAAGSE